MAEPAGMPAAGRPAGPGTIGSVAMPLLWFALALPFTLKALGTWGDTLGLFMRSLGEADPWSWTACLRALAGHLGAAAGLLAIGLGAHAAGYPASRWIGLPAPPASLLAFRVVSGFGIVAMVMQGLGYAGLWVPGLLGILAGLLAAAGLALAVRGRAWRIWHAPAAGARAPAVAAALLAVVAFSLTRLPDTHDDPRTYHFAAPEAYLRLHKIHAEPLNVNWHMPLGAEMDFGLGWAIGDIEGAKLLNIGFLIALMLATFRLAGCLAPGGVAGWWALGWLLTAGLVSEECWQGKNDLLLAADVAAAAWCAAEAVTFREGAWGSGPACGRVRGRGRWWLGVAWFLGHAAGVKFTSGFYVAGIMVAGLVAVRGRVRFRPWPVAAALFVMPVAGWLVASWAFLGDPVHPFLSGIFPDLGWGPRYQRALRDVMLALSPPEARRWPDLVFAPWRAWGDPGFGSLALMTLAPFGLLFVRGPVAGLLRWFVPVVYLLWCFSERNVRYLFPLVPVLASFAAAVSEPGRRDARWGMRILLAGSVVMALLGAGLHLAPDGWRRVTGQMGRAEFLARQFTTWERVRVWVNVNLPPDSRILFTGEERRLWFRPRVRSYYTVHEPVFWALTRDSATPADLRRRVRQMGLDYQLHNFVSCEYRALMRHPGPPWSDRQIALYREFTRQYVRPIFAPDRIDYANGGFWIFAFDRVPARQAWPVYYLPLTEGAFHRAFRLHNSNRPDEALREAVVEAARLAGVGEAELILAKIHASRGEYVEMYRILRPLVATGFIGDGSFKHLGGAAMNYGTVREGLRQYIAAWRITRDPGLMVGIAYGFYKLGQQKAERGDYGGAVRDLEAAVRLQPDQPVVLFEYAQALARAGRRDEAFRPAVKALRSAPADPAIRAFVAGFGARVF